MLALTQRSCLLKLTGRCRSGRPVLIYPPFLLLMLRCVGACVCCISRPAPWVVCRLSRYNTASYGELCSSHIWSCLAAPLCLVPHVGWFVVSAPSMNGGDGTPELQLAFKHASTLYPHFRLFASASLHFALDVVYTGRQLTVCRRCLPTACALCIRPSSLRERSTPRFQHCNGRSRTDVCVDVCVCVLHTCFSRIPCKRKAAVSRKHKGSFNRQ